MQRKLRKVFNSANKLFRSGDYTGALKLYSILSAELPDDKDIRVGILLSSLDESYHNEIPILYEFYSISSSLNIGDPFASLKRAIKIIEDDKKDTVYRGFLEINSAIESEDAIGLKDLKKLLKGNNGKEILQNIFFSTKIIITNKNDFIYLIESLIDNKFYDMAINYIDDASSIFPYENKLVALVNKIKKAKEIENRDK